MMLTGHKTREVFKRYDIINEQDLIESVEKLAADSTVTDPQGGGCSDASQCATGLFCSQGVCCASGCTAPHQSCAVPGRRGECISTVVAPAPVLSGLALLAAVATLIAIAAIALIREPSETAHRRAM